jgi:hypothetical protein
MPIVSQWKKCMKQDWTTASLTKNSAARHCLEPKASEVSGIPCECGKVYIEETGRSIEIKAQRT